MAHQKIVDTIFVFFSALCFWLLGHLLESLWDAFFWPQPDLGPLTLPWLLGLLGAGGAFVLMRSHKGFSGYINDVVSELGHVVWAKKEDVVKPAGVVCAFLIVAAVLLSVVDWIWSAFVRVIL